MQWRTRGRVASVALVTLALAGCSDDAPEVEATGSVSPSPSDDRPEAAASASGGQPASDAPSAPADQVAPTPPGPSSTVSTGPTEPAPATSPTDEGRVLPQHATPQHGGTAVGLYLAVVDGDFAHPDLQAATDAAAELGYRTGAGDLGCDQGAAEALQLGDAPSGTWAATALYFASAEDAHAVQAVLADRGLTTVGVAEVTTYCLD